MSLSLSGTGRCRAPGNELCFFTEAWLPYLGTTILGLFSKMAFPVLWLMRRLSPEKLLCKSCPGRGTLSMESGPRWRGSYGLPGLPEIIVLSDITEKTKARGHLHSSTWTRSPFQASAFLLHCLILTAFPWSPEVQDLLLRLPLVSSPQLPGPQPWQRCYFPAPAWELEIGTGSSFSL